MSSASLGPSHNHVRFADASIIGRCETKKKKVDVPSLISLKKQVIYSSHLAPSLRRPYDDNIINTNDGNSLPSFPPKRERKKTSLQLPSVGRERIYCAKYSKTGHFVNLSQKTIG